MTPAEASAMQAQLTAFFKTESTRSLLHEMLCAPLQAEIRSLKDELKERDVKIAKLERTVGVLLEKNDELEQYSRRNSMRISGLNEEENEDSFELVMNLANTKLALDPPLQPSDIDRVHRTGKPQAGRQRTLLVKFATYRQRDRLMSKRRALKETGSRIFMNEDLTKTRSSLLWHARNAKRQNQIKDCFSSDGRIIIRKVDGTKQQVRNLTELQNITSATAFQLPPPLQSMTTNAQ